MGGHAEEAADHWTRCRVWQRGPDEDAPLETRSDGIECTEELWQNERWWLGLGWVASLDLNGEPGEWTMQQEDGSNAPSPHATSADGANWAVVRTPSTDSEGWLYSTSFDRIDKAREGGRHAERKSDVVRKRKWVRDSALKAAREEGLLAFDKASEEAEDARASQAKGMLYQLLQKHLSKRSLWTNLDVFDIVAWRLLGAHHAALYHDTVTRLAQEAPCRDVELLRSLLNAASFAKASYGYPMLRGHMDTMGSNLYMHTVAKALSHDLVSQIDPATNNDALLQMTGLPQEALLHSYWGCATFCPAHALLVDEPFKRLVLMVRGTLSHEDALTDIGAVETPFRDGHVHRGMLEAAHFVFDECMPPLQQFLEAQEEGGIHYNVEVTGHSLGAGVAALVTLLLEERWAWSKLGLHCFAFAPPAVFTEELSMSCRHIVTSVVNGYDMIPRTSAANIDLLIHELVMQSTRTKAIDLAGRVLGGGVREYAEERKDELEALVINTGAQKMYAPGRLLLLDDATGPCPRLFFAEPLDVAKILLHPNMIPDHLPSRYVEGISATLAQCLELPEAP